MTFESKISNVTYMWCTYLLPRQRWGQACCERGWRRVRTLGTVCRTSSRPERVTAPPSARRKWLQPWFPASRTSMGRALAGASCAPCSDWCSSIAATGTASGIGTSLLEGDGERVSIIVVMRMRKHGHVIHRTVFLRYLSWVSYYIKE